MYGELRTVLCIVSDSDSDEITCSEPFSDVDDILQPVVGVIRPGAVDHREAARSV